MAQPLTVGGRPHIEPVACDDDDGASGKELQLVRVEGGASSRGERGRPRRGVGAQFPAGNPIFHLQVALVLAVAVPVGTGQQAPSGNAPGRSRQRHDGQAFAVLRNQVEIAIAVRIGSLQPPGPFQRSRPSRLTI